MRQEAGQGMNFLEAIFSFVFGDGDPNESYEDRRWRLVSVVPGSQQQRLPDGQQCCVIS